jgi:hypothetical protein
MEHHSKVSVSEIEASCGRFRHHMKAVVASIDKCELWLPPATSETCGCFQRTMGVAASIDTWEHWLPGLTKESCGFFPQRFRFSPVTLCIREPVQLQQ